MSSGIWQRGEEDEGVDGFLIKDIRKEVNRAAKLVRMKSLVFTRKKTLAFNCTQYCLWGLFSFSSGQCAEPIQASHFFLHLSNK